MISIISRKKLLIPRHSEVYVRVNSEARNRMEWHEKNSSYKISCSSKQNWQRVFIQDVHRNGIPWVCFYFCSTERNSRLVSLPRNCSQWNSESLLLFLFHSIEFLAFFSSVEWFGSEFREISVPRNSRNSAWTNQLFHLFRLPRNNFLSEIANPSCASFLCLILVPYCLAH